jgi:ribosome-associated protein
MSATADDSPASDGSALELAPGVSAPPSALRFQFARSSGPGGQNVNKVNTKAELWITLAEITGLSDRAFHRLKTLAGRRLTIAGEIHITADTERTQESNRQAVLERLTELVKQAIVEPKPRRKTKPSRASKQRRIEGKKHRGQIKSGRRGDNYDA